MSHIGKSAQEGCEGHVEKGIVASMKVSAIKTCIFKDGEDLMAFVHEHIPVLNEGSILVVASKIVALAEGRTKKKVEGGEWKVDLIREESEWARQVLPKWWLTVRDGTVVVNAGIDESNAEANPILLPEDSFASAQNLQKALKSQYGISNLGIIITDSRIMPLRAGVVGVALGYAGVKGVKDYRGTPDLFGRPMEVTQTNIADSLATSATLLMGEGSESQPLAVIEEAPVVWTERLDRNELKIPRDQDLFKHLFD